MRTGIANLPLHGGKAPRWLFDRMKRLARGITIAVVEDFSAEEVLKKLSDPFWFQAFGCVLGFDWHSSGVTTTVCGALKEGIRGLEEELGLYIAGGKGKVSWRTPSEIELFCEKIGREPAHLIYASRMSAKVDNAALQDGYQIYHHSFFFTEKGSWGVVQQGMNAETRYARRYHWLSDSFEAFINEPHQAICCDRRTKVLNMVASESDKARETSALISRENPEKTIRQIKKLATLSLPREHHIALSQINPKHLHKILLKTYEKSPRNFEYLLGIPGVGPKAIRSLSLISELIYGVKSSLRDPARFSFAHGGKDGHPYPVDRELYDKSIKILEKSLHRARIERGEKKKALNRLNQFL